MPNITIDHPRFLTEKEEVLIPPSGGASRFIHLVKSNVALTPLLDQLRLQDQQSINLTFTEKEIVIVKEMRVTKLNLDSSPELSRISKEILDIANSIFTPTTHLSLAPSSQGRIVKKISKEEASQRIKDLKEENKALQAQLKQKEQDHIKRIACHEADREALAQLTAEHQKTLGELQGAKEELEHAQSHLQQIVDDSTRELQEKEAILIGKQKELVGLNGYIEQLNAINASLKENLESSRNEYQSLANEKAEIIQQKQGTEALLSTYQEQINSSEKKADELAKELESIKQKLKGTESTFSNKEDELVKQINALNKHKLQIEKQLKDLEESKSETIGKKKGKILGLKNQLETTTEQFDQIRKKLEETQEQHKREITALNTNHFSVEQQYKDAQLAIQKSQQSLEEARGHNQQLQARIQELDDMLSESKSKVLELETDITQAKTETEKAQLSKKELEEALQRARAELEQIQNQRQTLQEKQITLADQLALSKLQMEQIEAQHKQETQDLAEQIKELGIDLELARRPQQKQLQALSQELKETKAKFEELTSQRKTLSSENTELRERLDYNEEAYVNIRETLKQREDSFETTQKEFNEERERLLNKINSLQAEIARLQDLMPSDAEQVMIESYPRLQEELASRTEELNKFKRDQLQDKNHLEITQLQTLYAQETGILREQITRLENQLRESLSTQKTDEAGRQVLSLTQQLDRTKSLYTEAQKAKNSAEAALIANQAQLQHTIAEKDHLQSKYSSLNAKSAADQQAIYQYTQEIEALKKQLASTKQELEDALAQEKELSLLTEDYDTEIWERGRLIKNLEDEIAHLKQLLQELLQKGQQTLTLNTASLKEEETSSETSETSSDSEPMSTTKSSISSAEEESLNSINQAISQISNVTLKPGFAQVMEINKQILSFEKPHPKMQHPQYESSLMLQNFNKMISKMNLLENLHDSGKLTYARIKGDEFYKFIKALKDIIDSLPSEETLSQKLVDKLCNRSNLVWAANLQAIIYALGLLKNDPRARTEKDKLIKFRTTLFELLSRLS